MIFVMCFTLYPAKRSKARGNSSSTYKIKQKKPTPKFGLGVLDSVKLLALPMLNYIWDPAVGYPGFPGIDQWLQGDWMHAALFSGSAMGFIGAWHFFDQKRTEEDASTNRHEFYLVMLDLSRGAYFNGGMLSSYYSFRYHVKNLQKQGAFPFLSSHEEVSDILLSPFKFNFLAKWTTIIPLVIAGGYFQWAWSIGEEISSLTTNKVLYAGGHSYEAGTGEEAVFRGYLMPLIYQWYPNQFVANGLQSLIFGYSHQLDGIPIFQLILGAYTGWVTIKNNWTISEAIFIHTWYDVLAFTASFADGNISRNAKKNFTFWFPPLRLVF